MKKNKKKILTAGITFGILASAMTGLYATSVSLNYDIPQAQGMVYLPTAAKSSKTAYGAANITKQSSDRVSFSVRALGGNFGVVTTSTAVGTWRVSYNKEYTAGTNMQGRFRNANWTTKVGELRGTFDYK